MGPGGVNPNERTKETSQQRQDRKLKEMSQQTQQCKKLCPSGTKLDLKRCTCISINTSQRITPPSTGNSVPSVNPPVPTQTIPVPTQTIPRPPKTTPKYKSMGHVKKGGSVIKANSLRKQTSLNGLRTSKKFK
jgi:hypothetical protein